MSYFHCYLVLQWKSACHSLQHCQSQRSKDNPYFPDLCSTQLLWEQNSNQKPAKQSTDTCLFFCLTHALFFTMHKSPWILPYPALYQKGNSTALQSFPNRFTFLEMEGNDTQLQYSCLENPMDGGAWWAAVHGVAKSQARLNVFTFTFHFHALEKEMATHSSVLAWRIPGRGEPSRLPSMGSHRVGHDWSELAAAAEMEELWESSPNYFINEYSVAQEVKWCV